MNRWFRPSAYVWPVPHQYTEQWLEDLSVVPPQQSWWRRIWSAWR